MFLSMFLVPLEHRLLYQMNHDSPCPRRPFRTTGDTLVEKCCHFFDLFRLITNKEANLAHIRSLAQRGLNYEAEEDEYHVPILDSAYVTLPFVPSDNEAINGNGSNKKTKGAQTIGCLELCMFAEGSRHQEEIIVTGSQGRLEAYLPENKVYQYQRPSHDQWSDRSVPPPKQVRQETVYDCSDVRSVHGIDHEIPTHGGYHYSSTAVEWFRLLQAMTAAKEHGTWTPLVSLEDGIKAVEIGLHATQSIVNELADGALEL
jgi:myo-inositol 2-dehydrogenase/D-chiro-inositol 1-dehydrogenase